MPLRKIEEFAPLTYERVVDRKNELVWLSEARKVMREPPVALLPPTNPSLLPVWKEECKNTKTAHVCLLDGQGKHIFEPGTLAYQKAIAKSLTVHGFHVLLFGKQSRAEIETYFKTMARMWAPFLDGESVQSRGRPRVVGAAPSQGTSTSFSIIQTQHPSPINHDRHPLPV